MQQQAGKNAAILTATVFEVHLKTNYTAKVSVPMALSLFWMDHSFYQERNMKGIRYSVDIVVPVSQGHVIYISFLLAVLSQKSWTACEKPGTYQKQMTKFPQI